MGMEGRAFPLLSFCILATEHKNTVAHTKQQQARLRQMKKKLLAQPSKGKGSA